VRGNCVDERKVCALEESVWMRVKICNHKKLFGSVEKFAISGNFGYERKLFGPGEKCAIKGNFANSRKLFGSQ
jgi:hypothetical protein